MLNWRLNVSTNCATFSGIELTVARKSNIQIYQTDFLPRLLLGQPSRQAALPDKGRERIVSIRLRTFARRTFHDPEPVLRRLRDVEIQLAQTDTPDLVRRLRTGRLKRDREARDALL